MEQRIINFDCKDKKIKIYSKKVTKVVPLNDRKVSRVFSFKERLKVKDFKHLIVTLLYDI